MISDVPVVSIKLGSSLKANDINEGDDVYFECDVRANPKAYKLLWFKDNKELHQNATAGIILPGGQSLVLQSVSKASAGEYSCMAVNIEGKSISRSVALEVMCKYILFCIRIDPCDSEARFFNSSFESFCYVVILILRIHSLSYYTTLSIFGGADVFT